MKHRPEFKAFFEQLMANKVFGVLLIRPVSMELFTWILGVIVCTNPAMAAIRLGHSLLHLTGIKKRTRFHLNPDPHLLELELNQYSLLLAIGVTLGNCFCKY